MPHLLHTSSALQRLHCAANRAVLIARAPYNEAVSAIEKKVALLRKASDDAASLLNRHVFAQTNAEQLLTALGGSASEAVRTIVAEENAAVELAKSVETAASLALKEAEAELAIAQQPFESAIEVFKLVQAAIKAAARDDQCVTFHYGKPRTNVRRVRRF